MSENRGEAGEGRNATDTHERHTRGRGAHLCAHHYRKKDGERKKVGEEERGKKKKEAVPWQTSPVREGNRR